MHIWLSYYGNGYTAAGWTRTQREQNVDIIASYFYSKGWTIEAIAAMLGNIEAESYINPAQWEHSYPVEQTPAVGGYGLVQWTPWTKYSNWCGADWKTDYDRELERIFYEYEADIDSPNSVQWISTQTYPLSFYQFSQATIAQYTIEWLALCFFKDYERGVGGETARQNNALYWYQYLLANPPQPWEPTEVTKKFKLMFYLKPWWKRI